MKARLTILLALVFLCAPVLAQAEDEPFRSYYALEIGIGPAPIHTLIHSTGKPWDSGLAEKGQTATMIGAWCPAFSLSAAWHPLLRWEFVLTGGVSWCRYRVIQYGTFGVDPQGKPRYNLNDPVATFWENDPVSIAVFLQARCFWNPTQKVKLYSAAGFGAYTDKNGLQPVPSLTPIAVRFGTGPLKFAIEQTISPAATGFQLCLGWTF